MKTCIDDNSLSKFISLVVQIYLAVLAIANAFRKICLIAKENSENHVAWHELDELTCDQASLLFFRGGMERLIQLLDYSSAAP